jgi:tetratricopeptide (TPR) repeat protein
MNHRQAEPPRLVHLIRGDLDWIVMKCLEKDRTRRFETANALAMDVRRHLNNEPVVARPPSQLYRLQKLMRRNRFAFAASGMVAAIVILGLSVSLLLLHSEKQARRRALIAEQAETQMRQEAEVRRLSAQVQDLESEGKLPEAEASYRAMLAIQKSLLGEVNTNVIDSLDSLASLFNRQGKLPEAESTYREELAIRKKLLGNDNADVASSLDDLARVLDREGKHAEREGACREALAIRRRILGNQDPRVATSLYNLGWALWQRGELAEAETVQREALAIRRKTIGDEHSDVAWSLRAVAWVLRDQAKLSEAETAQRELLALGRKRPGANFPHEIESLANLSHILQEQNKLAEAETVRREVVAIRKKLRAGDVSAGVTSSLDDLAGLLERQGKLSEAAAWRREMVAIQQRVLGNENTIVASSLDGLAYVLERETKLIEAEACRREALQIKRKLLGSENPLVANSIHWLGDILARQGRFAEAEAMQREALATQRKLLGNEHEDTIWSLRTLAWALRDQGKLAEAESVQREALALIKKTRGKDHADVASVLGDLAYILEMQNKLAEAETAYREALAGTENQSQNAGLLRSRGNFRARTGRWTEAVADLSKALLLDANEPFPWLQLASLLIETGDLTGYQKHRQAMLARLAGTSDPRIAEMTAKAALLLPVSGADLTTASRLADMAINAGKDEQLLAYFQFAKGLAEYRQGRFANSVEWTEKALAAPEVAFRAVQASMVLAMAHHQLKQSDEARAALAKGVEIAATKLPKLESADLGSDWRDWIIGHALMREAKILIEGGAKAGDQTK